MLNLLRDIHFPISKPLQQVIRREIDQFHVVSTLQHRIRHRLTHPHARDLGDDIIQAFEMLHVDGGVDGDAGL